jgi:hypothetical protein
MSIKQLEALTTDNWPSWSSKFEATLDLANLLDVLHDNRTDEDFVADSPNHVKWRAKTRKCLSHLIIHIGDTFLFVVNEGPTANAAWKRISERMTSLSQLGAATLYSKLQTHFKEDHISMQAHIDHMVTLRKRLLNAGTHNAVNETHFLTIVVNSVPTTVHNAQTIACLSRMINNGTLNMNELLTQLLEAERLEIAAKLTQNARAEQEKQPPVDEISPYAMINATSNQLQQFQPGFTRPQHNKHDNVHVDRRNMYKSKQTKRCEHCHRINHTIERCYVLNGYPKDHPSFDASFKPVRIKLNATTATAEPVQDSPWHFSSPY